MGFAKKHGGGLKHGLLQAALRPLGQEALRRRGELTPDESHRIHTAYQVRDSDSSKNWSSFESELGGGFKCFFFFNVHPYLGKMSNLTNIFQMG